MSAGKFGADMAISRRAPFCLPCGCASKARVGRQLLSQFQPAFERADFWDEPCPAPREEPPAFASGSKEDHK
jgi:hypothetical protein